MALVELGIKEALRLAQPLRHSRVLSLVQREKPQTDDLHECAARNEFRKRRPVIASDKKAAAFQPHILETLERVVDVDVGQRLTDASHHAVLDDAILANRLEPRLVEDERGREEQGVVVPLQELVEACEPFEVTFRVPALVEIAAPAQVVKNRDRFGQSEAVRVVNDRNALEAIHVARKVIAEVLALKEIFELAGRPLDFILREL